MLEQQNTYNQPPMGQMIPPPQNRGASNRMERTMDAFLLDNSIGEYQIILAYHKNKATLDRLLHAEKIRSLKKMYGRIEQQVGLEFCKGLVDYYDNL